MLKSKINRFSLIKVVKFVVLIFTSLLTLEVLVRFKNQEKKVGHLEMSGLEPKVLDTR